MNKLIKTQDMVLLSGNEVITTSLKVAQYFNKRHKDVLRAIKNINCSQDFNERNFAPVDYFDEKGEQRAMYNITKNGCMFLVMGFTGKAASEIKEAFINAFDEMQEVIRKGQHSIMKQHNDKMLEYMKEKDVASMSGRLLNRWGRVKKPQLIKELGAIENKMQLNLPLLQ